MKTKELQKVEAIRPETGKHTQNVDQVATAENMEKLEAAKLTPRKVLENYLTLNAEKVARLCISRATKKNDVSFEDAKERTFNFSRVFTTSEEKGTPYKTINGIAFNYSERDAISAGDILQSYESLFMILEAERKEAKREAAAKEKDEKVVALAEKFGIDLETARAMAKAGALKF